MGKHVSFTKVLILLLSLNTSSAFAANKDARAALKRNLDIVGEIPQDLLNVPGFEGETTEFNPFGADAEANLENFDEAYRRETGDSGRIDNGSGLPPGHPFADLFERVGGCYQTSCPVFVYISRAEQKLTLYLNGRAVDQWAVSTGTQGFETPRMDQHFSTRIYTKYSSKKYPGGDFNGLGNMPYAIFIRGGFAIHGTPRGNWPLLGTPASHGCIRLHPSHAKALNQLVRENGNTNSWILID